MQRCRPRRHTCYTVGDIAVVGGCGTDAADRPAGPPQQQPATTDEEYLIDPTTIDYEPSDPRRDEFP